MPFVDDVIASPQSRAVFASGVRYVLAVVATYVGVEIVPEQANAIVGGLTIVAFGALSLWWSKKSDKKLVQEVTK